MLSPLVFFAQRARFHRDLRQKPGCWQLLRRGFDALADPTHTERVRRPPRRLAEAGWTKKVPHGTGIVPCGFTCHRLTMYMFLLLLGSRTHRRTHRTPSVYPFFRLEGWEWGNDRKHRSLRIEAEPRLGGEGTRF